MQRKVEQNLFCTTSRSKRNAVKSTVEPINEEMMGTDPFAWHAVLGEESSLTTIDPSHLNEEQVNFYHVFFE